MRKEIAKPDNKANKNLNDFFCVQLKRKNVKIVARGMERASL